MSKGLKIKSVGGGSLTIKPSDSADVVITLPENGGDLAGESDLTAGIDAIVSTTVSSVAFIEKPAVTSPLLDAIDFTGVITTTPFKTIGNYKGQHLSTEWKIALDANFTNMVLDSTDIINLEAITIAAGIGVKYFIKCRYNTPLYVSEWSGVVSATGKGIIIDAPVLNTVPISAIDQNGFPYKDVRFRDISGYGYTEKDGVALTSYGLYFIYGTSLADLNTKIAAFDAGTATWESLSPVNNNMTIVPNSYVSTVITPDYNQTLYVAAGYTAVYGASAVLHGKFSSPFTITGLTQLVVPVVAGDSIGYEFNTSTLTISNYSSKTDLQGYTINVTLGSIVRTGNTLKWSLPAVTADTQATITISNYSLTSAVATSPVYSKTITAKNVNGTITTNWVEDVYRLRSGNLIARTAADTHNGATAGAAMVDILNHTKTSTTSTLYVDDRGFKIKSGDMLINEIGDEVIVDTVVDDGVREYVFDNTTSKIYADNTHGNAASTGCVVKSDGTLYYGAFTKYNPSVQFNAEEGKKYLDDTCNFIKLPFKAKYVYFNSHIAGSGYAIDSTGCLWTIGNTAPFFYATGYTTPTMNTWRKTQTIVIDFYNRWIIGNDNNMYDVFATNITAIAVRVWRIVRGSNADLPVIGCISTEANTLYVKGINTYSQLGTGNNTTAANFVSTGLSVVDAVFVGDENNIYGTVCIEQTTNLVKVAGTNSLFQFGALLATSTTYLNFTSLGIHATHLYYLIYGHALQTVSNGLYISPNAIDPVNATYNSTIGWKTTALACTDLNSYAALMSDGYWYANDSSRDGCWYGKGDSRANYKITPNANFTTPTGVFGRISDLNPYKPNLYVTSKTPYFAAVPKRLFVADTQFNIYVDKHTNTATNIKQIGCSYSELYMNILYKYPLTVTNTNTTTSFRVNGKEIDVNVGDRVVDVNGNIRNVAAVSKSTLTKQPFCPSIGQNIITSTDFNSFISASDKTYEFKTNGYYDEGSVEGISPYPLVFKKIMKNQYVTLALTTDGVLYGKGSNMQGGLGAGPYSLTYTNFTPLGMTDVVDFCLSYTSTFVLKWDGTVYVTGGNDNGELGINAIDEYGDTVTVYGFTPISIKATAIAAGYNNFAMIGTAGDVYVAGSNQYNAFLNSGFANGNDDNHPALTLLPFKATAIALSRHNLVMINQSGFLVGTGVGKYLGVGSTEGYSSNITTSIKPKYIVAGESCTGYITDTDDFYVSGSNTAGAIINTNICDTVTILSTYTLVASGIKTININGYNMFAASYTGEIIGSGTNGSKLLGNTGPSTSQPFKRITNSLTDPDSNLTAKFNYRDKYYSVYTITVDTPFPSIPTSLHILPKMEIEGIVDTVSITGAVTSSGVVTSTFATTEFSPVEAARLFFRTHRKAAITSLNCSFYTVS